MISIQKLDVPEYLRSSPLFENAFQDVDDGDKSAANITIEIPADCLKQTPEVRSKNELRSLLLTVRFWLIPEYIETCSDLYSFAFENKDSFIKIATEFGEDFPFLEKLRSALQPKGQLTSMGEAATLGLLGFVKYLRSTGATWVTGNWSSFPSLAARAGHLDCLQYGVQNGCKLTYDVCSVAAKGGHLECLKYAHGHGATINYTVMESAITFNQLPCVMYIVGCNILSVRTITGFCESVAREGNLVMLSYLLGVGCEAKIATANAAAAHDHLNCLQLLHEKGCPVSSDTSLVAVQCGSLQCVKYLHSIGCVWDGATLGLRNFDRLVRSRGSNTDMDNHAVVKTSMFAAQHGCSITQQSMTQAVLLGSVEFVAYLHRRGIMLETATFHAAVIRQHIACIQYFLDHDYPSTVVDYIPAVRCDRVESVRCMHEYGVVWDSRVTAEAVRCDKPTTLCYLLDHGCPVAADSVIIAAKWPKVACLQCLHEHGVPLTAEVVATACTNGSVQCLQYALDHGCPYSNDVCDIVASRGDLPCLQCLHEHGAPMTSAVVNVALSAKKYDCVAYALTHGCQDLGPTICLTAAALKSFRPLEQLHKQGVPFEESTCLVAIRSGSFECLKYAVIHGCSFDDCTLLAEAALHGRRDMLKWLHKKCIAWDARITAAAVHCDSVKCLKYAIQRHCPYNVQNEALEESPHCREYMEKRGHNLVKRAMLRVLKPLTETLVKLQHGVEAVSLI